MKKLISILLAALLLLCLGASAFADIPWDPSGEIEDPQTTRQPVTAQTAHIMPPIKATDQSKPGLVICAVIGVLTIDAAVIIWHMRNKNR